MGAFDGIDDLLDGKLVHKYKLFKQIGDLLFHVYLISVFLVSVLLQFQGEPSYSLDHIKELLFVIGGEKILVVVVLERNAVGYLEYSLRNVIEEYFVGLVGLEGGLGYFLHEDLELCLYLLVLFEEFFFLPANIKHLFLILLIEISISII